MLVKLSTSTLAMHKCGKNAYRYTQEVFLTLPVPGPISWAVVNKTTPLTPVPNP